ncbi:MAG: transglutaminase family protein [Acidobacteria bacterium]|nr:transglutaminase family protein [Acidobacteriota bacterium]
MVRLKLFPALALLFCSASFAGGIQDGGEWTYDLIMGGNRMGRCMVTSTPVQNGVLETRANIKIELIQAGQTVRSSLSGRTTYEWPGGHPSSYDLKITASAGPEVSFAAQFGEGQSTVTMDVAGQRSPSTLDTLGDEYVLDNNFLVDQYMVMLAAAAPGEGDSVTVRFITPQIVSKIPKVLSMVIDYAEKETVKLGTTERDALKLTSKGDTGLQMYFWIDPDDRTLLRWTVPAQQTEVILSTGDSAETKPADMDRLMAGIISKLYIPTYLEMGRFQEVADLKMRISLCAVAADGFPKNAPKQAFEGKSEENGATTCIDGIVRTGMTEYDGKSSLPLTAPARAEDGVFLKSTVDAPAEHPDIIKAAKEAATGAETRWDAAAAVARWVHSHIRYEITGSGALEALRQRRGDCGPQSLLSLAMIRSLGVPARLAGGLLYVGGKFGQHNWIEVMVRPGEWIPIDPTSGEIGRFSASHVALWRGGGALAPDAMPMQIEVLSFSRVE